ncbi:MAG: adenylate/guanylate cyclase domain-containing protein [Deltaproteobacteria bacterium]|nr:MAG: adenylate/guanylate cyclase domain-containing protein [Deltaproteobacteria bacterium]
MSNAAVKILDWGQIYQESLGTEILRSERRRVTILAGLFAFAACVYSFLAFVPGPLTPEFRVRFHAQWPWIISLYGAVAAYEWALRAAIGWLIEHRRQPNIALRFVNAFVETSIPTVMLFMAVSLMGPRDALGSPAFLLYFFFILLSILRLDVRLCLFTGLVAAVEHFIFMYVVIGTLEPEVQSSFWRTPVFNISRSLILFVAGLVAALVTREIRRQVELSLRTVQDRDRAVRIFGQYVSPQIAEKLLHQPVDLGGELRNVCVMFLDIRNFSSYAAGERPEAVMAYLNTLFDFMIDVVNEHHGIVNKFLGDGFMAVYGAPIEDAERCAHAVGASLEILERLDRLNAAGKIHPTRVGIGLHMGEAVTGNVGSNDRKEYTIIGDVVNLASRLEQATKDFQARLLISEAVRRSLDAAMSGVEDLGPVPLKGQPNPARIFKVA